jgi:hypothetical protein
MAQGHKTSSSLRTIAARSRFRPESQTCSPRVNCIETSLFPSLPCLHSQARPDGITRTAGHNPQRHVALVNTSATSRRRCAADRHTLLRRARSSILTPIYLAARLKPITHAYSLRVGILAQIEAAWEAASRVRRFLLGTSTSPSIKFPDVHRSLCPGTSERRVMRSGTRQKAPQIACIIRRAQSM